MSNIFIISGPSGAGEDSVIKGLNDYFNIEKIITTTTREKRPEESEKNPYYFVSKKTFIDQRERGNFIEWAQQYNKNLYGVTKKEIKRVRKTDKIGIWKIEWKGVITAKKIYPEIKSIFITTPDLKTLENRIRRRGEVSEKYIKERMAYTKKWLKYEDIYDYKVINEEGKLKETVKEVAEIIKQNL